LQGLEDKALQRLSEINNKMPDFGKKSEVEKKKERFNRYWHNKLEIFHYIILSSAKSARDMVDLKEMTYIEITDYYLSTILNG